MIEGILARLRKGLPKEERLEYTRRAFRLLPEMDRPRILDIACGPGVPTVELARLSNGTVTGIDIDQAALDQLRRRALRIGVSNRIRTLQCSITEMDFAGGSFDVVWSEGATWHTGFEESLRDWRHLVRLGGFLVIHDGCLPEPDPPAQIGEYWRRTYPGISTHEGNLARITGCGYDLRGHFLLPERAWWDLYFGPLSQRIPDLRAKHANDPEAIAQLEGEEAQAELCRKYPRWFASAFYIMEKW